MTVPFERSPLDDTRMPEHPATPDPHYAELVETSVRLRAAQALLDAVRDLHGPVQGYTEAYEPPLCGECGNEIEWPCDTVIAATPAEGQAELQAQAEQWKERVRTRKARLATMRQVVENSGSSGMIVETVADIEDVRSITGRTLKIGDRVYYDRPATGGFRVLSV